MLFTVDGSIASSAMILFAAGPNFFGLDSSILDSAGDSLESTSLTSSILPSLNSAINSELLTISPSCLTILEIVPFTGATTSNTTLSVSISAITSSC